jgi:16S rRNA (adenine1518-N6/adenine1519-N6)-dimethyltransferase
MMIDIKDFLKRYNFRPNSLLGQNFLFNDWDLDKIVSAAEIKKGEQVFEIGSGIGNLTKLLAEQADFVLGVEKDERYFPILKDVLGTHLRSHTKTPKSISNVEIVFADVTRFNFQEVLEPGYKVVANIPYYITGKIVEMLVTAKKRPTKIVLLMQKEVAERIIAPKGELSILAISVQLHAKTRIADLIPKESFYPQPKVDSAILVLDLYDKPLFDVDEKKFFKVVKACFVGKRKQIHNTLKNNLKLSVEEVRKVLAAAGIGESVRPQELDLEDWYKLYKEISSIKDL